jgi:hypothetical protein
VVHPASLHILTPGSPAYALAKVGAIGGLIALRVVMARRDRAKRERAPEPEAPLAAEHSARPHPVSRKKRRRRRR